MKIVAAHDAGTIINPDGAEGQIEGGVVQGLGAALCEEMLVGEGIVTNPSFAEYKIPTSMDVPEIVPVLVGAPHADGPYGAKGLAEPALAPTAPAIANAVFNATGARITSLPITPEKVLRAPAADRQMSSFAPSTKATRYQGDTPIVADGQRRAA